MTAESGNSLDNEACVDPDHLIEEFSPPGETDNCSTHTTVIVPRSPNLLVTKSADPGLVTPAAPDLHDQDSNVGTPRPTAR